MTAVVIRDAHVAHERINSGIQSAFFIAKYRGGTCGKENRRGGGEKKMEKREGTIAPIDRPRCINFRFNSSGTASEREKK